MASSEIDSIIQNCTSLMCHIVQSEYRLDDVIRRSHALNEKLKLTSEYQHCVNPVAPPVGAGSRRTALLGEFRLENRKLLHYQEENRNLKCTVKQCMDTIELVMGKYREMSTRLCNRFTKDLPSLDNVLKMTDASYKYDEVTKTSKFVHDWLLLKKQVADKTNSRNAADAQLRVENNGLREMLSLAEITNPGLRSKFTAIMAKMQQDIESNDGNCSDISDTGLNVTMIEISKRS